MEVLPPGSLAILCAAPKQNLAYDIYYRFRQDPAFLYLTGCHEPEAVVVLEKPQREEAEQEQSDAKSTFGRDYRTRIYVQQRDAEKELWDGPITGSERSRWLLGADSAFPIEQLQIHLPHLLQKSTHLYLLQKSGMRPIINALTNELGLKSQLQMHNLSTILDVQRLFKTPAELELLKQSAAITAAGFDALFRCTRPGMMEYELYARFEYEAKVRGAQRLAYPPVVASGSNANILHYVAYNMPMRDGDLVLVDAGTELGSFCSDVTRTYPVNGKFTKAQRRVYEHVLRVQQQCIEAATASSGNSINRLQKIASHGLTESLIDLGIIKDSLSSAIEKRAWLPYYPHNIGHYLGMDTHDTPSVSPMASLRPGMLITIEPGLYIPDLPHIPEEFRNIGVRIEDNVYIDDKSNQVLTAAIPKSVVELESIIGTAPPRL